jgi:hypothetical protein
MATEDTEIFRVQSVLCRGLAWRIILLLKTKFVRSSGSRLWTSARVLTFFRGDVLADGFHAQLAGRYPAFQQQGFRRFQ